MVKKFEVGKWYRAITAPMSCWCDDAKKVYDGNARKCLRVEMVCEFNALVEFEGIGEMYFERYVNFVEVPAPDDNKIICHIETQEEYDALKALGKYELCEWHGQKSYNLHKGWWSFVNSRYVKQRYENYRFCTAKELLAEHGIYLDGRNIVKEIVDRHLVNAANNFWEENFPIKGDEKMELKELDKKNLKEAKKQFEEERANAEIEYAKEQLRKATDKSNEYAREIKRLKELKKEQDEIIAQVK